MGSIAGVAAEGDYAAVLERGAAWWRKTKAAYYGVPATKSDTILGSFTGPYGLLVGGCAGRASEAFTAPLVNDQSLRKDMDWLIEKNKSAERWFSDCKTPDELHKRIKLFVDRAEKLLGDRQFAQADYFALQVVIGAGYGRRAMSTASAAESGAIAEQEAKAHDLLTRLAKFREVIKYAESARDRAKESLRQNTFAEGNATIARALTLRPFLDAVGRADLVRELESLGEMLKVQELLSTASATVVQAEGRLAAKDPAGAERLARRALEDLQKNWARFVPAGRGTEATTLQRRISNILQSAAAPR
jgi:hypothetical protein